VKGRISVGVSTLLVMTTSVAGGRVREAQRQENWVDSARN
jgi:hypothetical protein